MHIIQRVISYLESQARTETERKRWKEATWEDSRPGVCEETKEHRFRRWWGGVVKVRGKC